VVVDVESNVLAKDVFPVVPLLMTFEDDPAVPPIFIVLVPRPVPSLVRTVPVASDMLTELVASILTDVAELRFVPPVPDVRFVADDVFVEPIEIVLAAAPVPILIAVVEASVDMTIADVPVVVRPFAVTAPVTARDPRVPTLVMLV